jgi:alpha-galactosidase
MGAHVSASPNHADGRNTPLSVRTAVAMAGTFGYELDLSELTDEEKNKIRQNISDFHKYAELIHSGDYYRLTNPLKTSLGAWEIVSKDRKEALVTVVGMDTHDNPNVRYVKLKGLLDEMTYTEEQSGTCCSGGVLMNGGIVVNPVRENYFAQIYHFTS